MPLFVPDPTFAALRTTQAKRPAWLPGQAPYVDPSPGFVSRDPLTGNLMLNGQRWRGVGGNFGGSFGLSESNSAYGAPVVGGLHLASESEVDAAIDTAKAMGHNMARSFALLTVGKPLSIQPSLGVFPSQNFAATDYAIWRCGQEGIKLVFPLVDNYKYFIGGKFDYCNAVGVTPDSVASQFFTNSTVRDAFKAHISAVLTHVNPRNGIAYKDDPTILAWETGNELAVYPAQWTHSEWTSDIADHIKTVCGAQQLVCDGKYGVWAVGFDPVDTASLQLPNVDMYTIHANGQWNTPARVIQAADIAHSHNKAFLLGEFTWTGKRVGGFTNPWTLDQLLAAVEGSENVDADAFWQLLPPLTNHGDGFALHYPGDNPNMVTRAAKLADHAAVMRGIEPPPPPPPPEEQRTVITIPGAFSNGYNTANFGGALFSAPNVRVAGSWNSWWLSNANATTDINSLNTLIATHIPDSDDKPKLVVAGHSYGAQIIYKWIREKGPTSNFDRDRIRFISSGNPERKYGGRSVLHTSAVPPIYPGTGGYGVGYGLPAGSNCYGFEVIDIARQYDMWADSPDDESYSPAMRVVNQVNVHSKYYAAAQLGADGLPVNWDDWARFDEGDVIYLTCVTWPLIPEPPMSILARIFGGRAARNHRMQHALREDRTRGPAEAGYTRPVPVPIPEEYR